MVNKYYQKHKETIRRKARERFQNLFEEKNIKGEKKSETDIKISPKKKKQQKLSECMK